MLGPLHPQYNSFDLTVSLKFHWNLVVYFDQFFQCLYFNEISMPFHGVGQKYWYACIPRYFFGVVRIAAPRQCDIFTHFLILHDR